MAVTLLGWAGCGKLVGIHDSHLADGSAVGTGDTGADRPSGDRMTGAGGSGGGGGGSGGSGGSGSGGAVDGRTDAVTDVVADTMTMPDTNRPDIPFCVNEPVHDGRVIEFGGGPNMGGGVGSCSFPNSSLPAATRYYGGLDNRLFEVMPKTGCGVCVKVTAGTKQVEVFIIDGVNGGTAPPRTVAIERNALIALGGVGGGTIESVNFQVVPCSFQDTTKIQALFDITIPMTRVLVLDHRTRLTGVQVLASNGVWRSLTRQTDNRWLTAGFMVNNTATQQMRFIDSSNRTIDAPAVPFTTAFSSTGVQFPSTCP